MIQNDKGYPEKSERHVQDCLRLASQLGGLRKLTTKEFEDFRRLSSFRLEANSKDPRK